MACLGVLQGPTGSCYLLSPPLACLRLPVLSLTSVFPGGLRELGRVSKGWFWGESPPSPDAPWWPSRWGGPLPSNPHLWAQPSLLRCRGRRGIEVPFQLWALFSACALGGMALCPSPERPGLEGRRLETRWTGIMEGGLGWQLGVGWGVEWEAKSVGWGTDC